MLKVYRTNSHMDLLLHVHVAKLFVFFEIVDSSNTFAFSISLKLSDMSTGKEFHLNTANWATWPTIDELYAEDPETTDYLFYMFNVGRKL
jgi:hypothetical protein